MKSGIYKITNVSNGKIYIGKSTNTTKRFRAHKQKLRDTNKSFVKGSTRILIFKLRGTNTVRLVSGSRS